MTTAFVGYVLRTTTQLATAYDMDCKPHFGARSAPYTFASTTNNFANSSLCLCSFAGLHTVSVVNYLGVKNA